MLMQASVSGKKLGAPGSGRRGGRGPCTRSGRETKILRKNINIQENIQNSKNTNIRKYSRLIGTYQQIQREIQPQLDLMFLR